MANEKVIEILKKTNAMLEGHFLLSSGLHSDKYFQCALALEHPENSEFLVSELVKKIDKNLHIDKIIGPALGGVVVGYELARQMKLPFIFAERENNIMTLRRGFNVKEGEKVLICEDVITTGKSIFEVRKILEDRGAEVVAFASLINRTNDKVNFDVPYFYLLKVYANTYSPSECPLCKEGKIPLVKPGSRKFE